MRKIVIWKWWLQTINSLLKPILDKITWPLKIITLGLFSLVLNMAIIWFLDLIFLELVIAGFLPLFLILLFSKY
jgi:uncharacterized membrane protein YvlD (DUF360 family)